MPFLVILTYCQKFPTAPKKFFCFTTHSPHPHPTRAPYSPTRFYIKYFSTDYFIFFSMKRKELSGFSWFWRINYLYSAIIYGFTWKFQTIENVKYRVNASKFTLQSYPKQHDVFRNLYHLSCTVFSSCKPFRLQHHTSDVRKNFLRFGVVVIKNARGSLEILTATKSEYQKIANFCQFLKAFLSRTLQLYTFSSTCQFFTPEIDILFGRGLGGCKHPNNPCRVLENINFLDHT